MAGKKFVLALLISLVTFNLWSALPSAQAGNDTPQVLVLLAHDSEQQLASVCELIEANAGHVTHTFPNRALIARMPSSALPTLAASPAVSNVFTQAIAPSDLAPRACDAQIVSAWNSLLASETTPPDVGLMTTAPSGAPGDALTPPDVSPAARMALGASNSVTPGYYQTSEFMAGSVAVGIVLVESDSSVDLSTEDWNAEEKQKVFSEIVTGLNWWAEMEPRAHLSFVYDDHFSNPLPTGVEPITRPYSDQKYWIADAMSDLGYDDPFYFTQVREYTNAIRAAYDTDWAFTIFVVDSSSDSDNHFSDGYFAYAYVGGPFLVMTSGNNGYGPDNMDAVVAHEMGHIFHALDQYYNAHQPCTRRSGYLDVENQNSQYGNCASDQDSIMRGGIYPYGANALDPYAAGQIGWRDSDGDGILDPLDTDLPVSVAAVSVSGDSVTISGTAEIIPYPSPSRTSVTINTLMGVQYRFNGGEWQQAAADDGAFDGTNEGYHFTALLSPGLHTLDVAAFDSAGNVSEVDAVETLPILDPVDGGLNTELEQLSGAIRVGNPSVIRGTAYHLEGEIVAGVEYRINGGPWQPAAAQDGKFDSDYEPFSADISALGPGDFILQARASDASGYVESNFASEEFTIVEEHTIFLPLICRG